MLCPFLLEKHVCQKLRIIAIRPSIASRRRVFPLQTRVLETRRKIVNDRATQTAFHPRTAAVAAGLRPALTPKKDIPAAAAGLVPPSRTRLPRNRATPAEQLPLWTLIQGCDPASRHLTSSHRRTQSHRRRLRPALLHSWSRRRGWCKNLAGSIRRTCIRTIGHSHRISMTCRGKKRW